MRFLLVAALLVGALLAPSAARADAAPSFLGPVGYILTPSARTLGRRQWALAFNHRPNHNYITADYSPYNWAELGVTLVDPTRPGPEQTEVAINAKVLVFREGPIFPAIAVGVWDLRGYLHESRYVVATKSIQLPWPERPVQLSFGSGDGEFTRNFGALSAPITGSVRGLAEFDGTHLNVGARMELPRGFLLDVAAVNWELGLGAAYGAKW